MTLTVDVISDVICPWCYILIELADTDGVQDAVVEAVLRAYFAEGRDIGQTNVLLDVVAGAGLNRGWAEAVLSGDQGLAAVRAVEDQARRSGVQGVPYVLINKTVALSGAREPSAFLTAFERAGAGTPTASDEGFCKIGPGGERSC